jgi:hypothetical protein
MKLKFISFILTLLLASCDRCEEDPTPKTELEKLPPATQEGKHTFGCLVDGKSWVTRISTDVSSFYQEGVLLITAFNNNKDVHQGMSIHIHDQNLSEQQYHLSDNNRDQFSNAANFGDSISKCAFETTSEFTGTVVITHLDEGYGKWIISGTFEFEAYSSECQQTVKVTDGRFDLTYAP